MALLESRIIVGQQTQALATVRDASGAQLEDRAVTWSTGEPSVATVDQAGVVLGVGEGSTPVRAVVEGKQGEATVTVPRPAVIAVEASLDAGELHRGQTTQARAVTRDALGHALSGRAVVWSTDNAGIATVGSTTGVVTAVALGTATITGTSEGVAGGVALEVTPWHFGTGTQVVGTDIVAGLYRSANPTTETCYWERLSGFGGSGSEIIANDFAPGPAVVAIAATDRGFRSDGCATWREVTGPITASPTAPFGAGTYVVGSDVAAGTWRAEGMPGESCYWARLSGFGGTGAEIIANDFGSSPSVVTIAQTDAGFHSDGCGEWSKT